MPKYHSWYQTAVMKWFSSTDYGGWLGGSHHLEKIFEDKELPGRELPRVLEGNGYGIIEDCGGPRRS